MPDRSSPLLFKRFGYLKQQKQNYTCSYLLVKLLVLSKNKKSEGGSLAGGSGCMFSQVAAFGAVGALGLLGTAAPR